MPKRDFKEGKPVSPLAKETGDLRLCSWCGNLIPYNPDHVCEQCQKSETQFQNRWKNYTQH